LERAAGIAVPLPKRSTTDRIIVSLNPRRKQVDSEKRRNHGEHRGHGDNAKTVIHERTRRKNKTKRTQKTIQDYKEAKDTNKEEKTGAKKTAPLPKLREGLGVRELPHFVDAGDT